MAGIAGFLSSALESLIGDLEAGTEEGVRIEVEKIKEDERRASEEEKRMEREDAEERKQKEDKRKEKEKLEAERRKKRDEDTAFWTTPGLRPLAEPPILDWDWFFRTLIPSDLRYEALFPNDPEKRCMVKDIQGEQMVLEGYTWCAGLERDNVEIDEMRRGFYKNLYADLYEGWQEVCIEFDKTYDMATDLARFEFENLDNDGRTTMLEQWIKKGADIFNAWGAEVREKNGHLVPSDFVENHLATFEFLWLDSDHDTSRIEEQLNAGNDILAEWPQEVQNEYGYLRCLLPSTDYTHDNCKDTTEEPELEDHSDKVKEPEEHGESDCMDEALNIRSDFMNSNEDHSVF